MLNLKVTIGTVDMDGYNGRDHHPEATDAGRAGRVLYVHSDGLLDCYTIQMEEKIVEVMQHEVASLEILEPVDRPCTGTCGLLVSECCAPDKCSG